jgi:hypothetical protein
MFLQDEHLQENRFLSGKTLTGRYRRFTTFDTHPCWLTTPIPTPASDVERKSHP